jgi:hypothetical protein
MALTISDIKAKTKASFARPSLFKVGITLPPGIGNRNVEVLNLNCYNAQIPGISVATTDKDLGYRSVAYQKLYDDVLLSFYCSEDLSELEFMQDWMKLISNPTNNRLGYYSEYASTIEIIHLARGNKYIKETQGLALPKDDNKKTLVTTLHEAYPKKIDPMQLDYSSNDIMRMTVNFTYRHYTQVWGDKEIVGRGNFTETSAEDIPEPLSDINTLLDNSGNLVTKNAQGFFVPKT